MLELGKPGPGPGPNREGRGRARPLPLRGREPKVGLRRGQGPRGTWPVTAPGGEGPLATGRAAQRVLSLNERSPENGRRAPSPSGHRATLTCTLTRGECHATRTARALAALAAGAHSTAAAPRPRAALGFEALSHRRSPRQRPKRSQGHQSAPVRARTADETVGRSPGLPDSQPLAPAYGRPLGPGPRPPPPCARGPGNPPMPPGSVGRNLPQTAPEAHWRPRGGFSSSRAGESDGLGGELEFAPETARDATRGALSSGLLGSPQPRARAKPVSASLRRPSDPSFAPASF